MSAPLLLKEAEKNIALRTELENSKSHNMSEDVYYDKRMALKTRMDSMLYAVDGRDAIDSRIKRAKEQAASPASYMREGSEEMLKELKRLRPMVG